MLELAPPDAVEERRAHATSQVAGEERRLAVAACRGDAEAPSPGDAAVSSRAVAADREDAKEVQSP